jgi:transcriptional regulator with XRE-family HTH domain
MSKKNKSIYGHHLASLRKSAGLSQRELARLLGVPQSNITFWEHSDKPPRSDLLPKLASILDVSVESLLNPLAFKPCSRPTPKLRKFFLLASNLPRHQQDKIADLLSAFIKQFPKDS